MTSSANAGTMCPTAKIARAIVGEPPESSSTRRLISAAESKYSHHRAAASSIAATSAAQPPKLSTCSADRLPGLDHDLAEQDDQEQPEALGEMVRVERFTRVRRAQRAPIPFPPRTFCRLAILGEHRVGLDADRDRPEHVAQRLRDPDRDREQHRRGQERERDPAAQRPGSLAGHDLRRGQHEPRGREAEREHRDVARRRAVDRDRRHARGDAAGEEQQPRRQFLDAVAVVEHREAHPRPPQRREQAQGDPHAAHLRLGHDQVRELRDRQDEHEVEVELDPGDPLARLRLHRR